MLSPPPLENEIEHTLSAGYQAKRKYILDPDPELAHKKFRADKLEKEKLVMQKRKNEIRKTISTKMITSKLFSDLKDIKPDSQAEREMQIVSFFTF